MKRFSLGRSTTWTDPINRSERGPTVDRNTTSSFLSVAFILYGKAQLLLIAKLCAGCQFGLMHFSDSPFKLSGPLTNSRGLVTTAF